MATLLRASLVLRVAHGERQLVVRELRDDQRVMQRINPGTPIDETPWTEIGRYKDLDKERARLRADGWEIEELSRR
ncbi:MAG TPA: hypothetical protein VGS01_12040 [Candidatus Limnocylindria bacterium]|nr:hypothetical protein [Candidatus Limnocylindria bacterium]